MSSISAADPYVDLEDLESEASLSFAKIANRMCLKALGDPTTSSTSEYSRILKSLESDERIPFVSKMGKDVNGKDVLYNLWKDSKNRKGLWRKTTMQSYEKQNPEWTTVLDVDALAREEATPWVWRGSRVLPRGRDPLSQNGQTVTRALISLSKGPSDSVVTREFDLLTSTFVKENAFNLPEAKTRASYKSRDVLLVGSDFGPDTLTTAGFPRTIREWKRGTNLADAPTVFEGEKSDIAVSAYIDDQRVRGGGIYEVRTRAITFHSSKYWVRKLKYEHVLAEDDPLRANVNEAPPFNQLEVPEDAEVDFVGNLLVITLRSDWAPEDGSKFIQGSIVYVNAHKFIKYGPKDRIYHVLFQPSERIACENYFVTKKFLVLSLIDNVKAKLEFYKLEKDANKLRLVGCDAEPQIRAINVRAVDPYEGDEFWLTTSGYTEPSTLWLADAGKMDSPDKKVVHRKKPEGYIVRKLKSLPEQFHSADMEVIQNNTVSKDGTRIPYFIVMKKGTEFNKKNRTLLYGYGGFEVSLGPHYVAPTGIAWLERGGVYVEANIRGGGEFGQNWHASATREKRHKAYEDFIAVAEDLIASKVCKAKTLAIRGGSNGGLLVANAYLMRPDLFGAVHCAVPILDLKRYKAMKGTESWAEEFGDPDSSDWDKYLQKISPYHNIDESSKKYPPILFTANTRDPRVHPGHARKMTKKLWEMGQGKKWPTYYYENTESGGVSDAKQYAFMTALAYDFLYMTLSKNSDK
eukprot:Nitzschia sp. Nitz4//scaffold121_size67750//38071//40463//NITZ4_006071-RA/size67750-augustus-gene-0.123-mRNA-1//1//CDS//3329534360//6947//frame0